MAFVFVQHQDPTHQSALPGLLAKATKLPVTEIEDEMPVEPNHIYIMPPNTNLSMKDGILILKPRTASRGLHLPIDFFFQSLGEHHKGHAIGIVLSGTASDGTQGLKAIKAAGGITFAQDEKSAKYFGMPQSAINAGVVDFVLPPEHIAREITQIASHPILLKKRLAKAAVEKDQPLPEHESMNTIFRILKKHSGVNFEYYKQTTITRRITRRMLLRRVETLPAYVEYLRNNPKEVGNLYEDILINVTNFFRDPETFESLKTEILPRIIKGRDSTIRIWVPGCSTGEEVYSIAICVLEFLGDKFHNTQVQIFATDISDSAIEKARTGIYSYDINAHVSSDRLRRFFTKTDRGYEINKYVRDLCIFAKHNVTKDPPFSRIDIVSCRNLLIYLGPVLQKKVVPVFHYALKSNGYLILGNTETIGGFGEYFFPADKKNKIFSKKVTRSKIHFDLPESVDLDKLEQEIPHRDEIATEKRHPEGRRQADPLQVRSCFCDYQQ